MQALVFISSLFCGRVVSGVMVPVLFYHSPVGGDTSHTILIAHVMLVEREATS